MLFKSRHFRLFHGIAAVSSIGLFTTVMASATIAQSHDQILEEVIVTAQKRAQSIQDVPISITAMSGEKIDNIPF